MTTWPTGPVPPEPAQLLEITGALRELTVNLAKADDIQQALELVVSTTMRTVPEVAHCGVTLLRDGHPATATKGDSMSAGVDEAQYRLGEGPCLDAIRDRLMVVSSDLSDEPRWPRWTELARESGVRGVVAIPLDVDDSVVGALILYTEKPHGLINATQLTGMLLAEHASLLLAWVLERRSRAALIAEFSAALRGDSPVAHAVGIVMAQRGCDPDEALDVLTNAAANANITLDVVAERLVAAVSRRRSGGTAEDEAPGTTVGWSKG